MLNNLELIAQTQSLFDDNDYNVNLNKKKILVLVACNTSSIFKKECIKHTLSYFKNECTDIVVANSINLPYNLEMKAHFNANNIKYYEVENYLSLDFGKWVYLLNNTNYTLYDLVIFINDSIILTHNINPFINLSIKHNGELYGYNDSYECNYHYQSYLFSIKPMAIYKFINMVNEKLHMITYVSDVIFYYEIKLISWFNNPDCFLKIGDPTLPSNIHYTNPTLFKFIYNRKFFPIFKIKNFNSF